MMAPAPALLAVTLMLAAGPAAAPASDGAQSARVRVCANATGRPSVWTSTTPLFDLHAANRLTAEADGEVRLPRHGEQSLYVLATAVGCAMRISVATAGLLELQLSPGRDVGFQIRDGDGPLPGRVERTVGIATVITHADKDGQGLLEGLDLRTEEVKVSWNDVSTAAVIAPTRAAIVLTLPSSGSITGRLLAKDRGRLEDATVLLIRKDAKRLSINDNGSFVAGQLAGGTYTLEVTALGYRSQVIQVTLEKRQRARVSMALEPAPQVTVRFVSSAGEPVAKPRLESESNSVTGFEISDMQRPRRSYVGTPDGQVDIRDLPTGVTQLVLNTPPFARLRLPVLDIQAFQPDIDLGTVVVGEGATLTIIVQDRSGRARDGVPAQLDRGPGLSPLNPERTATDAEGRGEIGRLGPGRYRLRVGGDERPGGTSPFAEEWFTVSESDTRIERTFTMGGVAVRVTAANHQGPLPGKRVVMMPGAEDEPQVAGFVVQTATRMINAPFNPGIRSVTDDSGATTLGDVPLGPARLSIQLTNSLWSFPVMVDGGNVAVFVPAATIELTVRDAASGAGVPAKIVWNAQGSNIRVRAVADPSGRAVLEGLPEGPGSLEVDSRSHEPRRIELPNWSAAPAEVLVNRVDQGGLAVRLVTPEGMPIKDATAELVQAAARNWKRAAVSDADGVVKFDDLKISPSRLVVRHPFFATVATELTPTLDMGITLVLLQGHRVTLRIPDTERTERSSQYEISLLRQTSGRYEDVSDDLYPRVATSGAEVELGLLMPGSYRATLSAPARTVRCDFAVRATAEVIQCPQ